MAAKKKAKYDVTVTLKLSVTASDSLSDAGALKVGRDAAKVVRQYRDYIGHSTTSVMKVSVAETTYEAV